MSSKKRTALGVFAALGVLALVAYFALTRDLPQDPPRIGEGALAREPGTSGSEKTELVAPDGKFERRVDPEPMSSTGALAHSGSHPQVGTQKLPMVHYPFALSALLGRTDKDLGSVSLTDAQRAQLEAELEPLRKQFVELHDKLREAGEAHAVEKISSGSVTPVPEGTVVGAAGAGVFRTIVTTNHMTYPVDIMVGEYPDIDEIVDAKHQVELNATAIVQSYVLPNK